MWKGRSKMNLPNKLTLLRVALVPFFMFFAAGSRIGTSEYNAAFHLAAGLIFAAASFTDFLDGYLARKYNLVTDFGKFMDPLADKCLTTAALIYMMADGLCHPVVLALVLFREFAVAGVRMIAAERGTVIAANIWGKVKTVLQMLTEQNIGWAYCELYNAVPNHLTLMPVVGGTEFQWSNATVESVTVTCESGETCEYLTNAELMEVFKQYTLQDS